MTTIAVKNVDEGLYRRAKALASLTGKKVGEVLNEALSIWIQLASRGLNWKAYEELEEVSRADNETYEKLENDLISKHRGDYVVIAGGRVLGFSQKLEEACALAEGANAKHAIVTRLEERPARVIDLGWSLLEQGT